MSAQNGDKARYGRLRKKKIAYRARMKALRKSLLKTPATQAHIDHADQTTVDN
jgi:hypothetical protein